VCLTSERLHGADSAERLFRLAVDGALALLQRGRGTADPCGEPFAQHESCRCAHRGQQGEERVEGDEDDERAGEAEEGRGERDQPVQQHALDRPGVVRDAEDAVAGAAGVVVAQRQPGEVSEGAFAEVGDQALRQTEQQRGLQQAESARHEEQRDRGGDAQQERPLAVQPEERPLAEGVVDQDLRGPRLRQAGESDQQRHADAGCDGPCIRSGEAEQPPLDMRHCADGDPLPDGPPQKSVVQPDESGGDVGHVSPARCGRSAAHVCRSPSSSETAGHQPSMRIALALLPT
jgi:hypothetical protein